MQRFFVGLQIPSAATGILAKNRKLTPLRFQHKA